MAQTRTRSAAGWTVGIAGTFAIAAAFLVLPDSMPTTVPALLLLVPIAAASALAGWRVGITVAALAGLTYSLAFLPPIGRVHIGLTQDVYVFLAFLGVAVVMGVLTARRSTSDSDQLLDDDRAMLLRSVSHDLRSPLSTIQTVSADLAENDDYDSGTQKEMMAMVASEADRLNRIVGNLLSISRVQAGSFQPEVQSMPVRSLVDPVTTRFERRPEAHLDVQMGDDLPEVLADPVQIDQVLTNLVENSLRFSPVGSAVVIGADASRDGVTMWVLDHGPGFDGDPALDLQAPHDSSGSVILETGSGMGLTVCRAIVEAHGGTITVDERDHGACVRFTLPFASPPPRARSRTRNMAET